MSSQEPQLPVQFGPIYQQPSADDTYSKQDISNYHLSDINNSVKYQTQKLDVSIDTLDQDLKEQTLSHGQKLDSLESKLQSIDGHVQSSRTAIVDSIQTSQDVLANALTYVQSSVDSGTTALSAKMDELKTVETSSRDYLSSIVGKCSTEEKQDTANSSLASIDQKLTSPLVVTSAQTSSYFHNSTASTNSRSVKASSARVYSFVCSNMSSGMESVRRYVKFFNTNTEPIVGSAVPVLVIPIEAGDVRTASFEAGLHFPDGLAFAITAGGADSNAVGVNAGEVKIALSYQ